MRQVRFTAAADRDLFDIASFLIRDRESSAPVLAFIEALADYCHDLGANPALVGTLHPEIGPDIRTMPHRGYTILLRYTSDELVVLRIVSSRRDPGSIRVSPED